MVLSQMLTRGLILNADDYGCDNSTNAAIAYCFSKSIINSASMMVNLAGFENGLELAVTYRFKDKIGIHINLTEGKSVTDLSGVGVSDKNGMFIKKAIFDPFILLSPSKRSAIKNEITQQYNKLVEKDLIPTHIDSHHHVHTLPWISGLFIELAREKRVKIRLANTRRRNLIMRFFNVQLNRYYKRNNLHFSDKFESANSFFRYFQDTGKENLIYEVMVHPAYRENELIDTWDKGSLEELLKNLKHLYEWGYAEERDKNEKRGRSKQAIFSHY